MRCDTSPDPNRLYVRRVLRHSSFNQVNCQEQRQFWRWTRQRDALQANNVDNHYRSRENSYIHPMKGNRTHPIATSQLPSTAVNWAAPSDTEIAIDENDDITPERVLLTRARREVYLSQLKCACGAHLQSEWGYWDRILDVHRRFPRIPAAMTVYATESKMLAIPLTPPRSIPVEWIPIPRDSLQSPIPTMLQMLTVNLHPCQGYHYAELDDCRMHCRRCTQLLTAIWRYYQWWTIKRPGNKRSPNWSCGTTLTASLSLYPDGNRVS